MSENNHKRVLDAIEDRYSEKRMASKIGNIVKRTGLPENEVRDIIKDLEGDHVLRIYEANGDPTVYVTRRMENSISSKVGEPEWITEYGFEEKLALQEQIEEKNKRVSEFQDIERLLYSTGDLLEDAVENAMKCFGFDPETTAEDEDMVVKDSEHTYVIEIKGIGGKIGKSEVDQLGGWISKKIDDGVKNENLTGVLIYNHQRNNPPDERDDPFTSKAIEFLSHHNASCISTHTIFEISRDLAIGNIDSDRARQRTLDEI